MINAATSTKDWAEKNSMQVFYSDSIDSTNSQAKRDGILNNHLPWLYVSGVQTKGRGRGNKTWSNTEAGQHLLSTWCFPLASAPQPIAVPLFGWAVFQALSDEFDATLSIKAPNDIYCDDKKMAGLLIESVSIGNRHGIFVGLGLNVNDSPSDVGPATSIVEEISASLSDERWHKFLTQLKLRFEEVVAECTKPEISVTLRTKILAALQKWPQNEIEKLLSNGDLVLRDSTRVPWNQL